MGLKDSKKQELIEKVAEKFVPFIRDAYTNLREHEVALQDALDIVFEGIFRGQVKVWAEEGAK